MPIETVKLDITIEWIELKNNKGEKYIFGNGKDTLLDPNWSKNNVIYRWLKKSNGDIADIGETERALTDRVNNYTSAKPESSAGSANKKVYAEHQKLQQNNDSLCLEFTDKVIGFNLQDQRERRLAERLLHGHYKPYLQ